MMGANEIPELFKEVEPYHLTNQTVRLALANVMISIGSKIRLKRAFAQA